MKTKKMILNIAMIAAVIILVICGILFVNSVKGTNSEIEANQIDSYATVSSTKGNVRIERNGIGYTLKPDTIIVKGDVLSTLGKSTAELSLSDGSVAVLDENTKLSAVSDENGKQYSLNSGNVFVNIKSTEPIIFSYEKGKLAISDSVFSINVHDGVPNVNVYYGEVSLTTADEGDITLAAGSSGFLGSNGKLASSAFTASSLNDFNIKQAQKISDKNLCVTSEQLETTLSKRAKLVENAIKEKERRNSELLSQGNKENLITIEEDEIDTTAPVDGTVDAPANTNTTPSSPPSSTTQKNPIKDSAIKLESGTDSDTNSRSSYTDSGIDAPVEKTVKTATIAISCRTLLDNMGDLTPGKDIYVPDNGMILSSITVEFKDGDTVFDILKRVCSSRGIQLEYSWSPIYNSYYIEGINHLYEFDGGDGSGWMYEVNGWSPNYGVSGYKVEDGDFISFDYTCDQGFDLGNAVS